MSFTQHVKPSSTRSGSVPLRSGRRRWIARLVVGVLVAVMLWLVWDAIWAFYYRGALAAPVKRADLVISVCAEGTIESAHSLGIKNLVRGTRNILAIVPDGSYVRKGELLVRLDSTSLDEAITAERQALAKAEAAVNRTKKNWEAARIAVDEYRDGKFVEQRLLLSREISKAEQKLANAEHSLLNIQVMYRMAFVGRPHVDARELAVEKAQIDLASVKTKRDVLEQFTRPKVLAELASKRDAAAAELISDEAILNRHAAKIARLEQDVSRCAIFAPRDAMVVYAGAIVGARQQAQPVYQGAPVRQYQTVLRLVDPEQMQVKVIVPRTELAQLKRGQRANLKVLDQELFGKVASIADRPEPPTDTSNNVKQHTVMLSFDHRNERFKPGMSAEVEILVQHRRNALVIPLLCVIDDGNKPHVRVKKSGGVANREVMLGIANDALVEVLEGVKEGELVLFNRGA